MDPHCRLCGQPVTAIRDRSNDDVSTVTCRTCGTYDIEGITWALFEKMETRPSDRHLLSAATRTAPVRGVGRVLINNASFTELEEGRVAEKTLTEKQNALLDWMAFQSRKNSKSQYGAKVKVDQTFDYPVAYCHDLRDGNADEWNLVMQPLLKRGLIEVSDDSKGLLRLLNSDGNRLIAEDGRLPAFKASSRWPSTAWITSARRSKTASRGRLPAPQNRRR